MKKILPLTLLLALTGCWVKLPTVPGDGVEGRGGEVRTLTRDIELFRIYPGYYNARELDGRTDSSDPRSEVLRKGARVKVGKAVKRIQEPGTMYFYECREVDGRERRFQLSFSMRDCVGLPKYSRWGNP